MTTYIVLAKATDATNQDPAGGYWVIQGQAEAHAPDQAVRKLTEEPGEYLAVPLRNATFITTATEVPPPKVTTTIVRGSEYLEGSGPRSTSSPTVTLPDPSRVDEPVPA